MIIVIANDLPDAVRGKMKLWFIEPKPNVFVSSVKDHTLKNVISYLLENCPSNSGVLIISSTQKSPGFDIKTIGPTSKKITLDYGYPLIVEKNN